MTTVLPRKSEVDAVLAVLEDEGYEDASSMAKQLVKVIAAELAKRDTFAVARGLGTDDVRLAHGPFYSQGQAIKAAQAARDIGLVAHVVKVNPADEAVPSEPERLSGGKRCVCGHPQELHGSAIKPKAHTTLGCCVYRQKVKCECKSFEVAK